MKSNSEFKFTFSKVQELEEEFTELRREYKGYLRKEMYSIYCIDNTHRNENYIRETRRQSADLRRYVY